jgi:fungal nitric oxide reductase
MNLSKTIRAGTGVIAACQSGNRDADVFSDPDPDTFDMHRKFDPVDGLGFGYGAHRCVAEYLAKTELEIVFCEYYGIDVVEAGLLYVNIS